MSHLQCQKILRVILRARGRHPQLCPREYPAGKLSRNGGSRERLEDVGVKVLGLQDLIRQGIRLGRRAGIHALRPNAHGGFGGNRMVLRHGPFQDEGSLGKAHVGPHDARRGECSVQFTRDADVVASGSRRTAASASRRPNRAVDGPRHAIGSPRIFRSQLDAERHVPAEKGSSIPEYITIRRKGGLQPQGVARKSYRARSRRSGDLASGLIGQNEGNRQECKDASHAIQCMFDRT